MIHLPDPGLDAEATRDLREYQREVDEAGSYADRVASAKTWFPRRNKRSNPTFKRVRDSLTRMCSGAQRCVYCEDSVGDEVEHIQPKDLYPCLVFVWTNYVYACGRCNGGKSNKFAVISEDRLVDVTRPRGGRWLRRSPVYQLSSIRVPRIRSVFSISISKIPSWCLPVTICPTSTARGPTSRLIR